MKSNPEEEACNCLTCTIRRTLAANPEVKANRDEMISTFAMLMEAFQLDAAECRAVIDEFSDLLNRHGSAWNVLYRYRPEVQRKDDNKTPRMN